MNETCTACSGQGQVKALVNYGGDKGCKWEMTLCSRCGASGSVSAEQLQRAAVGAAVRAARLENYETQAVVAARHGITPVEYSHIEQGRYEGELPAGLSR